VDDPEPKVGDPRNHILESAEANARLFAEHHQGSTTHDRLIRRLTLMVAEPRSLLVLSVFIAGWMGSNFVLMQLGRKAFDPPPFSALQGIIGVIGVYLVLFILATQRRDEVLVDRREQLILQLTIIGDRKNAKIIELLEEMRRDSPDIKDRVDAEAESLAVVAEPEIVLEASARLDKKGPSNRPD